MKTPLTITGVSLPTNLHQLLRAAARGKQYKTGRGRASVSKLIASLVGLHRSELQKLAALDRAL